MSTTIRSVGSAVRAMWSAAATAVPPDPPIRMPSSCETRRATRKLSSSLIGITSSITEPS